MTENGGKSALLLYPGFVSQLADRLEAAGLLRREPADDDGRGLYALLTEAGEEMLRRMWPLASRVLRETFVEAVGVDKAAAIAAGLGRAGAAVAASSASGGRAKALRS